MEYFSTRDKSVSLSAAEAVKMGLSRDGGPNLCVHPGTNSHLHVAARDYDAGFDLDGSPSLGEPVGQNMPQM